MDTAALIEVLNWALETGVTMTDQPSSYQVNSDLQQLWDATNGWAAPGVKERVIDTLRRNSELKLLDPGYKTFGLSWTMVTIDQTASWLLAQTRKELSPVGVVTSFTKFLETNQATLLHVYAVAGLTIEEPINLAHDAVLLPFESLPASYGRAATRQRFVGLIGVPQLPPISLLAISEKGRAVFLKTAPAHDSDAIAKSMASEQKFNKRASDIVRAIVACGPFAASIVGMWRQWDSPGIPEVTAGSSAHDMGISYPFQLVAPPVDATKLQDFVTDFIALAEKSRHALYVPIDRLNQAIRQQAEVDRAIDLGIALEALLLEGRAEGELSYRLSMRGAWLRGGGAKQRRETFDLLKTIYDLRSKAVHAGSLPTKMTKVGTADRALSEGIQLCAILIATLIKAGRWPDWDALVLGTDHPEQ